MKRILLTMALLGLLMGCSDKASGPTGFELNGLGTGMEEAMTAQAITDNPKAAIRLCGMESYNKFEKLCDKRDSQTYAYKKIAGMKWMTENLAFATEHGSWCYDCDNLGRLYDWGAAMSACPQDWHLPSDSEWIALEIALGMDNVEAKLFASRGEGLGTMLKSTSGWTSGGEGTNSIGFDAKPGGFYAEIWPGFGYQGDEATFWTSTLIAGGNGGEPFLSGEYPIYRSLYSWQTTIDRYTWYGDWGRSVRCVKDDD